MKKNLLFIIPAAVLLWSGMQVYGYWTDQLKVKLDTPAFYAATVEIISSDEQNNAGAAIGDEPSQEAEALPHQAQPEPVEQEAANDAPEIPAS